MKKFLSDSIIYLVANFISKGIGFFLLPFLTNTTYVPIEDYGQIILFSSFSLFLNPLITFGGIDLIALSYYEKGVDLNETLRKSNTNTFLFFILITLLFLVFSPFLVRIFGIPYFVLLILPFSAYLNHFSEELLLLMRFKGNASGFFKVFIFKSFIDIGITLFCLLILHWGWYSRIAGIFAGMIFSFAITIKVISFKNLFLPLGEVRTKNIIAKAFPFVLLQFLIIGLINIDKLIIPQFFKKEDLAVYGLAFQFGYLLPTITSAITSVTQPYIYSILSNNISRDYSKIKKILFLSFTTIFLTAILLYLCNPIFYNLLVKNTRFHEGSSLIPYILIAWMLWCFGAVLIDVIKKVGSRVQLLNSYLAPFFILLFCLFFFRNTFGLKGIALSLIISYGVIFLLLMFYTKKQLNISLSQNIKSGTY